MSNYLSGGDVARCRADMTKLLTEVLDTTRKIERRLDVSGGWLEATAEIDINTDPTAGLRIEGALLLRKARIHTAAALRANKASNLHSLAVQMRPVLECAGQVVFRFRTLFIAPDVLMSQEKATAMSGTQVNADFYQTLRRGTKGRISSKNLRKMAMKVEAAAAEEFGAAKPKRQKTWSFNQADKVVPLAGGRAWYDYLSEYFSHGRVADWRGLNKRFLEQHLALRATWNRAHESDPDIEHAPHRIDLVMGVKRGLELDDDIGVGTLERGQARHQPHLGEGLDGNKLQHPSRHARAKPLGRAVKCKKGVLDLDEQCLSACTQDKAVRLALE